jgi:acyl carrier protein
MGSGRTKVRPHILADGHSGPPRLTSDRAKVEMQPAEAAANGGLEREIAGLITQALNLEVKAADIDADAPLYRDGLGLDSIDILEIALVVSKRYGIEIKAESEENHQIFRSLRHLAEFVAAQRTR